MAKRKTIYEKAEIATQNLQVLINKLNEGEKMKFIAWLKDKLFGKPAETPPYIPPIHKDEPPPVEDVPTHPDSPPTDIPPTKDKLPDVPVEDRKPPVTERTITQSLSDDPGLFPGGQNAFTITSDETGVIADQVDSGTGTQTFTLSSAVNAKVFVDSFKPGTYSPVKANITVIDPTKDAVVNLRVTNQYHGILIRWESKVTETIPVEEPPINPPSPPTPIPTPTTGNFLRVNPANPARLIDENGKPFFMLGLNDLVSIYGNPLVGYGLDGEEQIRVVDLDTYLTAYKAAGFNFYRWNAGNFVWDTPERWRQAESFINKLKEYGFRIQFCFFTYGSINRTESGLSFIRRIIETFGSKIDIWEVCNESTGSEVENSVIGDFIKANDPFKRIVTTSFRYQYPQPAQIMSGSDAVSPHLYQYGRLERSGRELKDLYETFKQYEKPIIIGEYGYADVNWVKGADESNRINAFVAYFLGLNLLYWNTSGHRPYSTPNSVANIYLGVETRKYLKVFTDFIKNIPADVRTAGLTTNNPGIKSYCLSSEKGFFGYLFNSATFGNDVTNTEVSLTLPKAGNLRFINPSTGAVVSQQSLAAGQVKIKVPTFKIDLALEVT